MTKQRITIDDILTRFLASFLDGKSGLTRQRLEEAERQLRRCIDTEAPRILEDDDLLMLAAERQFDPDRAAARLMGADDLIFLLSIFVESPWQPTNRLQRAAQLRMTGELATFVLNRRLVDHRELACPILDIQVGIDRGQEELRRQRNASSQQ